MDRNQTLHDDLIKFEVLSVEKAVELEEQIDEFKVELKAKIEALVWNEEAVKDMIYSKIETGISSDKQLVETSQDVFDIKVSEFSLEENTAKLSIHTENQVSMPIDINNIKDELNGLSEFEARRLLLGKGDIKDVRFKFNYSITSKIPNNGNRINIKLNFK